MQPHGWASGDPTMSQRHRSRLTALAALGAALSVLGLGLASPPPSWATSYSARGAFDEGGVNSGVAVDQAADDVYVANFFEPHGLEKFDASGKPLDEAFAEGSLESIFSGVAVDPENHNVYAYRDNHSTGEAKIATYPPTGGTPIRSFVVTGGTLSVHIGSDAAGDVYYPNATSKQVEVFAPTAEGAASRVFTLEGTGAAALVEPTGVAVDSVRSKAYVIDSGNGGANPGRVQVFGATGGYESTLDEGGSKAVTVDPVNGDVFVLDLSSEGSCATLSSPCYRVRGYHSGETTAFAEFGAGKIMANANFPDSIAVDHSTESVYVADIESRKTWIFRPGTSPLVTYPTEASERVTGLAAFEATLHGEVNPQGNETFCHFEYGTSTVPYEHSVPCQQPGYPPELVGEGSRFRPESVTVTGLEGNTTYHFRLVATTAGGEVVDGADQTFTTRESAPTLGGVAASDVTQGDVHFNATINAQHLDTKYWFDYSRLPLEDASACTPSVPYASAPATPTDLGEGSAPEAVSLDLAGAPVVLHPGMGSRELQPNTAYRFQVVAENAAGRSCGPEATFLTLPPDPLAGTGAASGITQTTASLAGTVTPGSTGPNSDTTWRFQYGTDTSYSSGSVPTTPGDAGMGTSAVAVATSLGGLAPNTTYHYRLLASNANADPAADPAAAPQLVHGADHTLATLPAEPLVSQPTILSETEATLEGHANPSGHPLQYRFDYGASSAYGQSTPLAPAGEGTEYAPVSATLTRLTPGVTYHYRLVAVGAGGETFSPDATFTLYAPAPAQGGNPFAPGTSAAAPLPTFPLLSPPLFPPATESGHGSTPLTHAQLLAKALRACAKKPKKKRARCFAQAKKRYGTTKKAGRRRR